MRHYWHHMLWDDRAMEWGNVWAGDAPLQPTEYARRRSPSGYAWGYDGAGPRALAHSILAHATDDLDLADRWSFQFKDQHVSRWEAGWRITQAAVRRWVAFVEARLDAPAVWADGPPDPPEELQEWLGALPLETYCDVAKLAYYGERGVLGDLLEDHDRPREWALLVQAWIPDTWLPEGEVRRD